jgi:hypothetical protein
MSVEAAMIVQYVFCFEHMFKTHLAKDYDSLYKWTTYNNVLKM